MIQFNIDHWNKSVSCEVKNDLTFYFVFKYFMLFCIVKIVLVVVPWYVVLVI